MLGRTMIVAPQLVALALLGFLSLVSCSSSTRTGLRLLSLSDDAMKSAGVSKDQTLPFVTVAYAQTLDGTIAPLDQSRLDLSSEVSFQLLHSLRARHDAVLIGVSTLKHDSPRLNVRSPLPGVNIPDSVDEEPRPVVLDSKLSLLDVDGIFLKRPIVFSCHNGGVFKASDAEKSEWNKASEVLRSLGGDLVHCAADSNGRCDMVDCLKSLRSRFLVRSVLAEGGAAIINTVLEHDLVDQLFVTLRPAYFGGFRCMNQQLSRGLASLHNVHAGSVGGDVIMYGRFKSDQGGEIGEHDPLRRERDRVTFFNEE